MSVRDRQVRDAMRTRDRQIKNLMDAELQRLATANAGKERAWGGHWSRSNPQPRFCYSTEKIQQGNDEGWASWIETPKLIGSRAVYSEVRESFHLHRQRRQAKARAWNMWQGWRLARGLKVNWTTFG